MDIKSSKHVPQAVLHNPLKNYELDYQEIEDRVAP